MLQLNVLLARFRTLMEVVSAKNVHLVTIVEQQDSQLQLDPVLQATIVPEEPRLQM